MADPKILPKLMVAVVPIRLKAETIQDFSEIDVVIIDDKPQFMEVLINHYLKDIKVKLYASPYQFLKEYVHYDKTTPICLDNDFGIAELNGRMLAEKLHQEGYERLYLISGQHFTDLPFYLTAISKSEISHVF